MSKSLVGFVIDTLEFAREGRSVSGTVAVSALPRLLELLGESALCLHMLDCTLTGRQGRDGNWLRLQVAGQFDLSCQRCLGPLPFVVALDTELQVIAPGQPWPDEELEDGTTRLGADAIAADPALVVTDLIEEEVLLALPIAPKHENDCVPPVRSDEQQSASPFAVLAQMKKH